MSTDAPRRTPQRKASDALSQSLDPLSRERLTALKAWRASVAKSHNLPAYVVFHDATLAEMARISPQTMAELGGISGVGAKRLQAYGAEILAVLQG